jgi:flagellar biosynthetic protein FliR
LSGIDAGVLPQIAAKDVVAFVLVLGRVGPLFLLAPVFSSRMLPARVKLILAGAIAFVMTPIAMHGQPIPADSLQIAPLMVKEVTIGLAFSLSIGVLAAAVQAAGGLLDTLVGFSFGALIDPFDNSPAAVLGQVYSIFATMIFLLTGGDQIMVMGLAKSYDLVPLGHVPTASHLAALATTGLAQLFVVALEIAAPVVIALLLADIAFALVSRAVPQMNVFAVGTPAKVLIGFATVSASLPFLATHLEDQLQSFVLQALTAMKV